MEPAGLRNLGGLSIYLNINVLEDTNLSYNVSFISLGCAKNQVNCEQMMAVCQAAGYNIQAAP